jgi:hypothetical protein
MASALVGCSDSDFDNMADRMIDRSAEVAAKCKEYIETIVNLHQQETKSGDRQHRMSSATYDSNWTYQS